MKIRLTKEAEADIVRILKKTKRMFGANQVSIYAKIIADGVAKLADDPIRPSSLERNDITAGVRSFHLELVTRRRGSASHVLYYIQSRESRGTPEVIVIGVLFEAMEPRRRLNKALRSLESEKPQST